MPTHEWTISPAQQRWAQQQLSMPAAAAFLAAMRTRLADEGVATSGAAEEVVRVFAQSSTALHHGRTSMPALCYVVRRALGDARGADLEVVRAAERAAVPLYCIAACGVVDHAVQAKRLSSGGARFFVPVPTDDAFVCGLITTTLFGGKLELETDNATGTPRVRYVFDVTPLISAENAGADFYRAVLDVLFPGLGLANGLTLDSGPLPKHLEDRLLGRLNSIRLHEQHVFALVVGASGSSSASRDFAERYEVPVLSPSDDAEAILGVSPGLLREEIREFWTQIEGIRAEAGGPASRAVGSGEPVVAPSPPGLSITVIGSAAVSTGNQSPVMTGSGRLVVRYHDHGFPPDLLATLLELTTAARRAQLQGAIESHVVELNDEASKAGDADRGRLRKAIDAIKSSLTDTVLVGDTLDAVPRIVAACDKLLAGLQGLPLP